MPKNQFSSTGSVNYGRKWLRKPEVFREIISNDEKMWTIFRYMESVSESDEPVLIVGESGTGKELVAKALHALNGVKRGPFVAFNIAGVAENMIDDALFGHVKGAFTGASATRKGMVETACHGTLLLDEIGELSNSSQVKLLRLLQEREYSRLGESVNRKSEVRVVAATNRPAFQLRNSSVMRKDLFYRLSAHMIHLPPLRERIDDVKPLFEYFLIEAAAKMHKRKPAYPDELIDLLKTYPFPGNVRELRSMVFDAVSTHDSRKMSMRSFEERIFHGESASSFDPPVKCDASLAFPKNSMPTWDEATRLLVSESLRRCGGNQSMAARMIKMNRSTMLKKMRGWGMR